MTNGNNLIHSFNHTADSEGNFHGLTKREYFCVNAPDLIPAWFVHTEPEKPKDKNPDWTKIDIEEDKEICRQWVADGCFDLPEHLSWFSDQLDKTYEANLKWAKENSKERYFQWRAFYADALITELNKTP